jgi:hypothetical protein
MFSVGGYVPEPENKKVWKNKRDLSVKKLYKFHRAELGEKVKSLEVTVYNPRRNIYMFYYQCTLILICSAIFPGCTAQYNGDLEIAKKWFQQ